MTSVGQHANGVRGGGHDARRRMRAEGLAYARAWRIANRARFDALYPPPPIGCPHCGRAMHEGDDA